MLRSRSLTSIIVCRMRRVMSSTILSPAIFFLRGSGMLQPNAASRAASMRKLRRDGLARGFDDSLFAGEECGFERRACGNRREGRGHAYDRAVEIIESFLLNTRGNLCADAALFDGFMCDDQPAGFLDRIDDGLGV